MSLFRTDFQSLTRCAKSLVAVLEFHLAGRHKSTVLHLKTLKKRRNKTQNYWNTSSSLTKSTIPGIGIEMCANADAYCFKLSDQSSRSFTTQAFNNKYDETWLKHLQTSVTVRFNFKRLFIVIPLNDHLSINCPRWATTYCFKYSTQADTIAFVAGNKATNSIYSKYVGTPEPLSLILIFIGSR
jgi:hypothetical protein